MTAEDDLLTPAYTARLGANPVPATTLPGGETKSVVGVTTNPTIFASAVANGDAYDQQLRELAGQGADVEDIVRVFTTDDVRQRL
jgi:hypothetical protein